MFSDVDFNNSNLKLGTSLLEIDNTDILTRVNEVESKDIKQVEFRNCKFFSLPDISDEIWRVEFFCCEIVDATNIQHFLTSSNVDKKVYFNECHFNTISFGDTRAKHYSFHKKLCYFELNGGKIEMFTIENIDIPSKLYINKQYDGNDKTTKIKNLKIENAKFNENFKLHKCEIENSIIKDSDFEKHADFYKSVFSKGLVDDSSNRDKTIYFKALNFRGLALFGDCEFKEKVDFKYVTFEGHSHFRKALFEKGLDLDYTNIQQEINFFDIKGLDLISSKENTSQETYRIIKHNFQKIGNQIEANKFYALELGKKREALENEKSKNWLDYIVFKGHWISSEHSTNWALALSWIIVIGLFTSLLTSLPKDKSFISCVDEVFKHMYILDKSIENPILLLLNKLSLGYLYYQFLTAIRKDTRK